MPRYPRILGTQKVATDYTKINQAIDAIESDMVSVEGANASTVVQINDHKSSTKAHSADAITYKGKIQGAENSEQAIDYVDNRVDTIISGGGEGKDPELTDIKTPDPSYIPERTITTAGDMTRDMQAKFSSQLAQKAQQTEVARIDFELARIDYEKAKKSDIANISSATPLFATSIELMSDTTKPYVNTTDGMLYLYNSSSSQFENTGVQYQATGIMDKAVSVNNTDFIMRSSNLFNPYNIVEASNIDNTSGALVTSSEFNVTDYITVKGSNIYSMRRIGKIAFYGKNKNYIGYTSNETFTVPVGASYIRCVFYPYYLNQAQINEGNLLLPYAPPALYINNIRVDGESINNLIITEENTSFIEKSSNLFNAGEVTDFTSIHTARGDLVYNSDNVTSNLIKVTGSTAYIGTYIARVGFYNINKGLISSIIPSGSFVTPSNCEYIRVVVARSTFLTAQLNKGENLLAYEPYFIDIKHLKPKYETILNGSSNLFNPYNSSVGFNVQNSTGALVVNEQFNVTDFIKVKPSTGYSGVRVSKLTYWDGFKKYLGYSGAPPFNTPVGAEYVRIVWEPSRINEVQLNEGEILNYEPFYPQIQGIPIQTYKKETHADFFRYDRFSVFGKLDGTYSSPTMPSNFGLDDTNHEYIYGLYDELVTNYPNYVTKTNLGLGSDGSIIYRYDFKAPPVPDSTPSNTVLKPKMILISGVHGEEKAGIFALYLSIKQICENWKQDELLETLRWNVHFIVVPVVNIHGYNNDTRKNANNVDIARNFPYQWSYNSNSASDTYGGEAPLTESETILIDNLLKENQNDTIYFTSFHNYQASNEFIWNASATKFQVNLGKQLISKMTRKWKKEFNWLPQDEFTYFGTSNVEAPPGSESKQAMYYGLQGSTFEITNEWLREPDYTEYTSIVFTLGVETFINWLILNLKENVQFYNKRL